MLEVRAVSLEFTDSAPGTCTRALAGVSMVVRPGECVALLGANGSGKSTLGNLMCGALLPAEGVVSVDGSSTAEPEGRRAVRRLVGRVAQNPADQLISTTVYDEVAFGPENLGVSEPDLTACVARALAAVGLAGFEEREVNALSGGEQQRLALAGVLAMDPHYVVLDEVTAMVDSAERPQIRALVQRLAQDRGMGVIIMTHDAIEALSCDRVCVLEAGRITWEGTASELVDTAPERFESSLLVGPYAQALAAAIRAGYDPMLGVEPSDLAAWCANDARETARARVYEALRDAGVAEVAWNAGDVRRGAERGGGPTGREDSAGAENGKPLLSLRGLSVGYEGHAVLSDVSLSLFAGDVMLVAGPSGAGKSTLATAMAGLAEPLSGSIELLDGTGATPRAPRPGDVGLAFQNPEHQFFLPTVREELAFAPHNAGVSDAEVAERVAAAARAAGVEDALLTRDPFTLSGGQARRVALASVLTTGASVVVLDEPTSGLDAASRVHVHELARTLAGQGRAVMVITHDLEEWLAVAGRVALIGAGSMVWQGTVAALATDQGAFERAGIEPPESWRLARLLNREGDAGLFAGAQTEMGAGGSGVHQLRASTATPVRPAEAAATAAGRASLLTRVDARVKLVLLFLAVAGVFLTEAPLALAVWFAVLAGVLRAAGLGVRRLGAALKPALFLLAFIVLANLVSCDGTASISLVGPVGLNASGAVRALTAIARIVLMVGASLAVTASTPPTQIASACVALGRPLRRLHVPVDEVGLVLSLALRFIPLVAEETARIRLSQEARGVDFGQGGPTERIGVWVSVLIPMVVGLFRRADRLAASMDARCFESGSRVARTPQPLDRRNQVLLVGGILCIVALVAVSHL